MLLYALFVYFPFEYTARLSLTQFCENLQTYGLHGGEIDTIIAILAHGIGTVVCHFLPFALSVLVIERPRLWCAEVSVVVVEVEPIHLYVAYLVFLVELIGDGLCSTLFQPPIVVGL